MLRQTRATHTTHDRRGAIALTTSAAVVICALTGLLAACGVSGGRDEAYVPVERPAIGGTAVAPTGEVTFVPLEGPESETAVPNSPPGQESRPRTSATVPGSPTVPVENSNSARTSTNSASHTRTPTSASTSTSTSIPTAAPVPTPTASSPSPPVGPAHLITGAPVHEATDKRWCEKVTLAFHNTGGSPVRSGTVTFGTHIIDLLGIDWATIESTVPLPAPIGPGARREENWTVCVEEWRVPWGMRVETRVVEVEWA
ncbi:hypothetical protein [Streptomyces sp. SID12488]|uniref:hypothetical protein n=1 Tax=Streptomyces sp. SID12488 TaxID=2706040 RepID=UPI0013DD8662|nr:hypothetical protein [Streptomyces sp. SID12488]NEA68445.1 hypothetical protein [Streptomyces sp. SID12488]